MKNKKGILFVTALLAASLMAGGVSASEIAADTPMLIAEQEEVVLGTAATHATCDGVITEAVSDEMGQYIVIGEAEEAQRLNLGEATVIILADGTPASFEELTVGTKIRGYHGLASTFSIPPQSAAEVIVIVNEETAVAPLYGTVASVAEGENGLEVSTADGNFIFFVGAEAEIVPYRTRNIVTAADIKAGRKILAWSEVMTMSLPAQAAPTKVMLLPEEVVVEEQEELLPGVYVQGELFAGEVKESEGTKMLPIRAISEKLGYEVIWNGEARSVLVENESNALTIVLDSEQVTGKERAALTLAKAPALIDGVTYVSVDFFELLTGDASVVIVNE
ncbi:MAG: copper amine oxidase N-terminal domain-containing protein [Ruminococcaceae bacterium]|nr:copper amine oxidase N-terminal domain-containing protein [Oscillospiraceae bacterium]